MLFPGVVNLVAVFVGAFEFYVTAKMWPFFFTWTRTR